MNLVQATKQENIETAKNILVEVGVNNVTFSGYSEANGVSVYFTTENGIKCRVSNHTTTNRDRMNEELQVSFDQRLMGIGGKVSYKSNFNINKLNATRFGF